MTKINIYYFSGTGNTAWVVRRLAERLIGLGDEVTTTSCEQVDPSAVNPATCDVMGIAFPIHSSFVPPIFRDFLQELPPGAGKPLFAVTTAGYWAGDMAWYGVKPLEAKGYQPFLLSNVLMGNNLHLPVLSPLPVTRSEKMVRRLEIASRKVDRLANFIHQRKPHVEGIDPLGRLLGIAQRSVAESFEARAFKGFFADGGCTRCGWCVRHCPVN
ncbi:MAG: EFR1 family ferrodoxin, partial [Chloroflexota bacterium]